jgi:hypothetical protein
MVRIFKLVPELVFTDMFYPLFGVAIASDKNMRIPNSWRFV